MPPLDYYKIIHGNWTTDGDAIKAESDAIMNETWDNDLSSRVGYFYDYYHDSDHSALYNLKPYFDKEKIKVDIKFLRNAGQTYSKDQVTVHIQFRPGQKCAVDYYEEVFEKRYGAKWPIGLYVDIPNEEGVFNRWLVVGEANVDNVTQFPTYEVLPCDYVFQYIYKSKKYYVPGVLRSQNSYNSGVWRDHVVTIVEDQQKFLVPLNRITEHIYYNLRMIIDANVTTEPRAWKVSKVNRVDVCGIANITLAQDYFDQHKDYIEYDTDGNVIGKWADYYVYSAEPTVAEIEIPENEIYSNIIYAGLAAQIKVGGSYKKFTTKFYENEEEIEPIEGVWELKIDDEDVFDVFQTIIDFNVIKIKAPSDQTYIGKILKLSYLVDDEIKSSIDVDIIAL